MRIEFDVNVIGEIIKTISQSDLYLCEFCKHKEECYKMVEHYSNPIELNFCSKWEVNNDNS